MTGDDERVALFVCGSRTWREPKPVWDWVAQFHNPALLVHGACRGPDTWAAGEATRRHFAIEAHPAQWDLLGRRAGFVRNTEMAERLLGLRKRGIAVRCAAFYDGNSRGTRHMVELLSRLGFEVEVIREQLPA